MAIINLHGKLGEAVGVSQWSIEVSSVNEAFHAINTQTNDAIRKFFINKQNASANYDVLINNQKTTPSEDKTYNDLTIERQDIEQIDVVPCLEGAFLGWAGILLGGIGLGMATNSFAAMTSIALIANGISSLLSEPPEFPEQRQITNPSSDPTQLANSYLFSGPVNVINEGGPVPIGYGRLIVGSQVIMSTYGTTKVLIREAGRVR